MEIMRTMMSTDSASNCEPSRMVEFCGRATIAILGTTSGHVEKPMACAPACRNRSSNDIKGLFASMAEGSSVLEKELSLSDRYSESSAELQELATRGRNDIPSRVDEPYRRAIPGVHGRMVATRAAVAGEAAAESGEFSPYASPTQFRADLQVIDRSLRQFNDAIIADDRLLRI